MKPSITRPISIALAIIICGAWLLLARVSEKDVEACVKATGWNSARCAQELAR